MKKHRNTGVREKLRQASGKARGRGRGIVIKGLENGKRFGARVTYATNPKKGGDIVVSNCPHNAIAKTMNAAARTRPDIRNPVGHISLSLPPSVTPKSIGEWQRLVQTLMHDIGLDEAFPYLCARHNDADHDHVHLVFSRISVDGRVHDQANLGLRLQASEVVIEDKFDLQLFPRGEMSLNVTKNEIEMGLRTGKLPPRMEIRKALEEALTDKPTIEQLVERLALVGVNARLNKSETTGKISGFSFEYDGIPFAASKIGKEYGWQRLQERITYEQQNTATEQAPKQSRAASPADTHTAETSRESSKVDTRGSKRIAKGANEGVEQATQGRTSQVGRTAELRIGTLDRRIWDINNGGHWSCGVRNPSSPIKVHQAGFETPAWFLLGDTRPVAVGLGDGGMVFPDHHRLSDEQLSALIKTVGDPVVLFGDEEYLERAARICNQLGVTYEYMQPQRGLPEADVQPEDEHISPRMGV